MKTHSRFRPARRAWSGLACGALGLVLAASCLRADEDEQPAAPAPQRVSVQNGAATVRLTPDEIRRSALEIAKLAPTSERPRQPALAAVLDLQPLLDAAANLAAARAETIRTEAAAAASRAEFERAKQLNAQNQNVSTKDLQAAEAAARSDGAAARAAAAAFRGRRAAFEQQWGPRLTGWVEESAPEFKRLLTGDARLVRVTQPAAGHRAEPPGTVQLARADGRWIEATLISAAPQVSPEFQAPAWYFLADAGGGLLPGMNVGAQLPAAEGAAQPGVVVPAGAVVWWQGRAWVYVQSAPGVFSRRELAGAQPEANGDFFVPGFPGDQPVVTRGAQVLLSEESKPAGAED